MSKQIDELERLAQLRANGLISEDEFYALKADIVDAKTIPSTADGTPYAKRFGPILLGLAAVAILGGGVHWLAKQDGYADARREGLGGLTDSNASNMGEQAGEAKVPSTDYLRLCLAQPGFNFGFRLSRLVDHFTSPKTSVSWRQTGPDWIMSVDIHDDLVQTDRNLSFQFQRLDPSPPHPNCSGINGGQVTVVRVMGDGQVADGNAATAVLTSTVPHLFGADAKSANPTDPALGGTAQSNPVYTNKTPAASSADALRSGRCKLVIKGQSYIDGPCFYSLDEEGSFSIYDTPEGTGGYFATLVRDGASGIGYWNGSKGSTHAQDELGTMSRNGACWSNGDHQICLWS